MILKKFIKGFEIDRRSDYSIIDIIRILRILSERPTGRIHLMNELGLGEATVKTMIKRLKNEGVLSDSTKGQILTGTGKKIAEEINERVSIFYNFKIPTITKKSCTIFVVRNSARKVKVGIEQRDEGMKLGVNIITLVYDGKNIRFPGTGEIFKDFREKLELKGGDVIIISSGEGNEKRERGGIAAALTLI
jgi:predicted transcriptional regulator